MNRSNDLLYISRGLFRIGIKLDLNRFKLTSLGDYIIENINILIRFKSTPLIFYQLKRAVHN